MIPKTLYLDLVIERGFILARITRPLVNLYSHLTGYILIFVSPVPWIILDRILISLGTNHWDQIPIFPSLDNCAKVAQMIRDLDTPLIDNESITRDSMKAYLRSYDKLVTDFSNNLQDIMDFEDTVYQGPLDYDYY